MAWLMTAVAAGALALFSTYWDDSLHTDVGRDTFWSAPHVLLYGSITATLAALALWAWPQVRRDGIARAAADPVLRWAAAAGAAVGIAAPADAAWHSAFGTDAVLWSPPHLLALVATLALTASLLRAIARKGAGLRLTAGGALVLGAALVPVMEYDSDVPQFSTVWYLPAVSAGVALAVIVVRRFDARPFAVTRAALLVTAVRLLLLPVLAGLGYSTPIVPPVLAVAVVADLVHRRSPSPWWLPAAVPVAAHAAYVPLLPLVPHGAALSAGQLLPSLLLSAAGAALVVLVAEGTPRTMLPVARAAGAASALLLLPALPLLSATDAAAHDPGQGEELAAARWEATVDGRRVRVAVTPSDAALASGELVARRAGEKRVTSLSRDGDGSYRGRITLGEDGRWFVYAAFRDARDRTAESWIPVEGGASQRIRADRQIYLPPAQTYGPGRAAATVTLYGLSAALLLAVARSGRSGRGRTASAQPRKPS